MNNPEVSTRAVARRQRRDLSGLWSPRRFVKSELRVNNVCRTTMRLCKLWRDQIEWCNRLVPGATWPWQRIYGLATTAPAIKRLKRVPSNSSNYCIVAAETDGHRVNAQHRIDNACSQHSTPAFFCYSAMLLFCCVQRGLLETMQRAKEATQ